MSVDRKYALSLSTVAENSGTRQSARDMKDVATGSKTAAEESNILAAHNLGLRSLLGRLNEMLPGASGLLRAAFDLKNSDAFRIQAAIGKINSVSQPETSLPPGSQSDATSLEQMGAASVGDFPQSRYDSGAAGRDAIDPDSTNVRGVVAPSSELAVDAATRIELANQTRRLQSAFQTQSPGMSQQDALDLLSAIRQLGEAFFQQGQNSVTKQEFEREKIALRRLIESKGK